MDEDRPRPILRLSGKQQAAVATAVTILAGLVIVCTVLGMGWLASAFLRRFSQVFLPIAVGAIAALVFKPYFDWLHQRLKLPRGLALVVVILSILLPVVAFGWFFGALAVEQISELVTRLPEWWKGMRAELSERWPRVLEFIETDPWAQRVKHAVEGQETALVQGLQAFGGQALQAGGAVFRGVAILASWVVLPIYFAFFLMADLKPDRGTNELLPFLKPETRRDAVYLVKEFVNIIVAFFRGQLIIAFVQGLMYAIGFSLVGLRYGFVLGLLLGLLNIIPYLGSLIGLGIGLPLGYFQPGGGLGLVAGVLVVFTVVQLIESYLLTPRIMGDRTGLHPVAIIVAIFFWGSALAGILGMILAIPLTAFLVVFWRLAKEKYIGELL
jgi:predicted PurR-regulated permease PerM